MFNRRVVNVYEFVIHQNHLYPQLFSNPDKNETLTLYVKTREQAEYYRDHQFRGCKMKIKKYLAIDEGDQAILLDWSDRDAPQRMKIINWEELYRGDRLGSMPETTQYCLQYGGNLIASRAGKEYRIMPRLLKALLDAPNASLLYYNCKHMQSFGSCTLFHIDLCTEPTQHTSIVYKDTKGTYSLGFPAKRVSLVPEAECKPVIKSAGL